MIYAAWLDRVDYESKTHSPMEIRKSFDFDLGVSQWSTPLNLRRAEEKPRVTEDGLTVPDWFQDDETESQQMLAAMGME